MNKQNVLFLASIFISFPAFSSGCDIQLSDEAKTLVVNYLVTNIELRKATKSDIDMKEKVNKLYATYEPFRNILQSKNTSGDEAIAWLLNVYIGEHWGSELSCEATKRDKKIAYLIVEFKNCLPPVGLEPLPESYKSNGYLVDKTVSKINSGTICVGH